MATSETAAAGSPFQTRPRKRTAKRWLAGLGALLAIVILTGLIAGLWLLNELEDSLPLVEGEVVVSGLSAPVVIERDRLGVPTVRAGNRLDAARSLGFLHAQERFFQMDLLLRRRCAGEVSALMGPGPLAWDRRLRAHRFRERARQALQKLPQQQRTLIDAYTEGVNAGLEALGAKPFEYVLLRVDPEPWASEDTLLVVFTMFLELQGFTREYEEALAFLYDRLPAELVDFLTPVGTRWDTPMLGEAPAPPAIPPPSVLDLRAPAGTAALPRPDGETARPMPGSNAFALAGEHTASGSALLANDLHFGYSVPNFWYRVSLVWPAADPPGQDHRVTGVTVPGAPAVVVGSNGRIAWGFTSSLIDATDTILLELDPEDENRYLTAEGPRAFERHRETLAVAHGEDETVEVLETIWGPVIAGDRQGRPRVQRWVAHEEGAVNLGIVDLETATTVDEAVAIAQRSGTPAQNFHVVDESGRIAWTILGRLPKRVGFDGRRSSSWSDGVRRWQGLQPPEEVPRIVDPPSGRLWSANNRTVSDEMLAALGDGGYRSGARARQIRDALFALEAATVDDLLAIQLDDRALFLEPWRTLLLDVLSPDAVADHPQRQELRRLVEEWNGRATTDAVGYRMVRGFRIQVSTLILTPLLAAVSETDPEFQYMDLFDQAEGPLWQLLGERPRHLLNPEFGSWDELLLAAVDGLLDFYDGLGDGIPLAARQWGQINTSAMRHVMSDAVPVAGRWLDLPSHEQAGDFYMPLVQRPDFGPTLRMVVSPGREEEGILALPGGESGHPFSPHYSDLLEAWTSGERVPFLPGEPVQTLTLRPGGGT